MGLIVLCMAEAGSRVSLTGGLYAYVEVAFGPFVGFLAGFLLWMVMTFVMAAVATVLTASLGALVPALASRGASTAVLVVIYGVFATVNILGVSRGTSVNTVITVAKILPLLLLIGGGLFAIDSANLAINDPPSVATLARSSILLLFAFAGIEAALVPGGEVKNPARTVPAAIFIAMVGGDPPLRRRCSSSRRGCSVRRWPRRRPRRWPTQPGSRWAGGRGTCCWSARWCRCSGTLEG